MTTPASLFEERIRIALDECRRNKYNPSDFEGLLRRYGSAKRVAEKLVVSPDIHTGLERLARLGRLDLSVEFIMLEYQFKSLFAEKVREAALWRLRQLMPELTPLQPKMRQLVIEVLREVGISTESWKGNDDPSKRSKWCFGRTGLANVVFVWIQDLRVIDGRVCFIDQTPARSDDLRREGSHQSAASADEFKSLINSSYFQGKPIRVAIVDGEGFGTKNEKVKHRVLDEAFWYPHHRDSNTGNIVVVRSVPQPAGFDPSAEFVQPFTLSIDRPPQSNEQIDPTSNINVVDPKAQTRTGFTTTYTRDPEVAKQAKSRAANGECEYCGRKGFETRGGGCYLEAHHVIPRNCMGPDELWNVVAICAEDHKRAHFGSDRMEIRDKLIELLGSHYPERLSALVALASLMDQNDAAADERLEDFAED